MHRHDITMPDYLNNTPWLNHLFALINQEGILFIGLQLVGWHLFSSFQLGHHVMELDFKDWYNNALVIVKHCVIINGG